MSGKYALIIGNTDYTDPGLAQLSAPNKDADNFARILKDQRICAFDDVNILLDQPEHTVRRAIDEFFDQKKPDDLLILYFSGHGVRDEYGALYLALKNTIRSRLRSTAIKSDYIREAMDQSRSKRQVLILDCCNSGAFVQGTKAATGISIGTSSAFEAGYGRVILTASDATQFAWEGDKIIGETENSLFTHFLVEGLKGVADRNGDGQITVDELYDYAYEQVKLVTPKQTPSKFSTKQQGEIVLRRNIPIENTKPVSLPDDLLDEIEDTRPYVREAAVQKLEKILYGRNIRLSQLAHEALERIVSDENTTLRVAQEAKEILSAFHAAKPVTVERYPTPNRITDKPNINTKMQRPEGGTLTTKHPGSQPARQPKNTRMTIGFFIIVIFGAIVLLVFPSAAYYIFGVYLPAQNHLMAVSTSSAIAASAMHELTSTAIVSSTNLARVESTGTAIARATEMAAARATNEAIVMGMRATDTAVAISTLEARNEYLSYIEDNAQWSYGPENGSLTHNDDDFIKNDSASVELKDFVVTATFLNPYSATTGSWDYGFTFRHEETNSQYRLVIHSKKQWTLLNNTGNPNGTTIQSGQLTNLNLNKGDSNEVLLICEGSKGMLYVNDIFVADLDLSARRNSGDISIATGFFTGNEINGYFTEYKEFEIWEIP